MARVSLPKANTAGVYAHLRQYFEADLQEWEANVSQAHATGAPFPRHLILDDLRAGRPANVPTYALPKETLAAVPSRPGPLEMYGPRAGQPMLIHPARAIVTPDDRIAYTDDDATRLWLEENEL